MPERLKTKKYGTLDSFFTMFKNIFKSIFPDVYIDMEYPDPSSIPDHQPWGLTAPFPGGAVEPPGAPVEPIVIYEVLSRTPSIEIKPRIREIVPDITDSRYKVEIWGQIKHNEVLFACHAKRAKRAEEIIEEIEDIIELNKGYFKENGIIEILYGGRIRDDKITKWRDDLYRKGVSFSITTEKIFPIRRNILKSVDVKYKVLSMPYSPEFKGKIIENETKKYEFTYEDYVDEWISHSQNVKVTSPLPSSGDKLSLEINESEIDKNKKTFFSMYSYDRIGRNNSFLIDFNFKILEFTDNVICFVVGEQESKEVYGIKIRKNEIICICKHDEISIPRPITEENHSFTIEYKNNKIFFSLDREEIFSKDFILNKDLRIGVMLAGNGSCKVDINNIHVTCLSTSILLSSSISEIDRFEWLKSLI